MNRGTRAYQQYERLRVDRAVQLAWTRERLAELGNWEQLQILDDLMTAFRASGPQLVNDPVGEELETFTWHLKAVMADLGVRPDVLDSVCVVAILDDAFSARMTRYTADGSGIVIVSDATLSLCAYFSRFAALTWERGEDPDVLTALLRYYNTHQRVAGRASILGIRLRDAGKFYSQVLYRQAAQFVLAHELAHYVLGHQAPVNAFSPEEYLPVCSKSQEIEMEADLYALRTLRRANDLMSGGSHIASQGLNFGAIGAVIAMLAVHVNERALYVRRGVSHPSAQARASRLLREMNAHEAGCAEDTLHMLLAAIEAASVFGPTAQSLAPEMLDRPFVNSSMPFSYLSTIADADALQCLSWDWYVRLLVSRSRDNGDMSLGAGAVVAAEGMSGEALRLWGLEQQRITQLCDPTRPLAFHSLYRDLRTCFAATGIVEDEHLAGYAIAAAMLVSAPLSRPTG